MHARALLAACAALRQPLQAPHPRCGRAAAAAARRLAGAAHLALPRASPRMSPGATASPSLRRQVSATLASTRANTACATHTPASTPGALARKVAVACVSSGTLR